MDKARLQKLADSIKQWQRTNATTNEEMLEVCIMELAVTIAAVPKEARPTLAAMVLTRLTRSIEMLSKHADKLSPKNPKDY